MSSVAAAILLLAGLIANFWVALVLIVMWGLLFAAITPIRKAYLNSLIDSKQRATVLSFDLLMDSAGGVVVQPALGKAADLYGYGQSYVICSVVQIAALPFLVKARQCKMPSDTVNATKK